jgi:hypothetical protein
MNLNALVGVPAIEVFLAVDTRFSGQALATRGLDA